MKAAVIDRYGDSDVVQYREMNRPTLKPDRLLVKVRASSVNPVDWKIRQGTLQLVTGYNFPKILGSDLSGVVLEVGMGVTKFRPGDEIYTFLNPLEGGAYAEYASVPEEFAARKPQSISHLEAATVPLAGLTALQSLQDLGRIKPGYKVLINGASGGVGLFAIQIAKAMNAEVTGVCSTKNVDFVKSLGADFVIDYTQVDFTQQTVQYDIILDAVSSKSFSDCESVLRSEGVYIATLPSLDNAFPLLTSWIFPGQQAKIVLTQAKTEDLARLTELIDAGTVKPVIDRTYPLAEVSAAHAYSETGRAVGKIAISMQDEA